MLIKKQYAIPGLLFCLFLLPFLLAWWCHEQGHLSHLALTNQGRLLDNPVHLSQWRHSKTWRLVYATQQPCEETCIHALATLARVRLALGRHLYGIELWLLLPQSHLLGAAKLAQQLQEMDVHVTAFDSEPEVSSASIWIVNQNGEGVLTYPDTGHPQAIYSDLKRLSPLWEG